MTDVDVSVRLGQTCREEGWQEKLRRTTTFAGDGGAQQALLYAAWHLIDTEPRGLYRVGSLRRHPGRPALTERTGDGETRAEYGVGAAAWCGITMFMQKAGKYALQILKSVCIKHGARNYKVTIRRSLFIPFLLMTPPPRFAIPHQLILHPELSCREWPGRRNMPGKMNKGEKSQSRQNANLLR